MATWLQRYGRTDVRTGGLLELLSQLKRQCAKETYLKGGVEKVSKMDTNFTSNKNLIFHISVLSLFDNNLHITSKKLS